MARRHDCEKVTGVKRENELQGIYNGITFRSERLCLDIKFIGRRYID